MLGDLPQHREPVCRATCSSRLGTLVWLRPLLGWAGRSGKPTKQYSGSWGV
ncbi:hypothetical protein [Streptomyces sp. NPDC001494]